MKGLSLSAFADKLNEIMPAMAREFLKYQSGEFYKMKVTMPQFVILDFLDSHDESKMTELANFLNVSTAAVTGIVYRMARDGYVVRVSDPKDRRIVKIKTTVKGKKLVRVVKSQKRRMVMDAFGKISAAERESYLNILMHVLENLKE